ncbi:hypothetical protein [uncultured Methylobacterium sp.]|jgi:hypothetical protein|uniref:hypothetical protein n=1 Tax=uncultured Methylobacterium sp. TaxID=157278 RepID=UPI00261C59EE|nr:hypothetical protein [uncultured Methylobacterium sp.]
MKADRIEARPKAVELVLLSDGTFAVKPGIDFERFKTNIAEIVDRIKAGTGLPDHYYRKTTGRDALLDDYGWMHLHVGHDIDDDVLLIVEQTQDAVILVALTDHTIFRERPRARSIRRLNSKVEAIKTRRRVLRKEGR